MRGLKPDKPEDFFKRTLYNLNLYNELHSQCSEKYKYEITMLLNSLLGLLVIQKENKRLNKVDIEFLEYSGSTKDFFRHMRNSIAHGHFIENVKVNDDTKEIEKITFIDRCPNCDIVTFEQTLSIKQLNQLVENIGKIYSKK